MSFMLFMYEIMWKEAYVWIIKHNLRLVNINQAMEAWDILLMEKVNRRQAYMQ